MKLIAWTALLVALGALAYWFSRWRARRAELEKASEQRFAALMAQARASVPPKSPVQLLFDAAAKAGEAGEPVLSIQLYARLLARYPESALAERARQAVEAQKKMLAKT